MSLFVSLKKTKKLVLFYFSHQLQPLVCALWVKNNTKVTNTQYINNSQMYNYMLT